MMPSDDGVRAQWQKRRTNELFHSPLRIVG
jgi:hypothetical protein